jgi:hypothetical protein
MPNGMSRQNVRTHACVFVVAVAFFVATSSAWEAGNIVRFNGEDMTVSRYDALCTEKIRSLMLGPKGENVIDTLLIRSQTQESRYEDYYRELRTHPKTFKIACAFKRVKLPPKRYARHAREAAERAQRRVKSLQCTGGSNSALKHAQASVKEAQRKLRKSINHINYFIRKFESSLSKIILALQVTKYSAYVATTMFLSAGAPLWIAAGVGAATSGVQELADQVGWSIADKRGFKPWKLAYEASAGAFASYLGTKLLAGVPLKFPSSLMTKIKLPKFKLGGKLNRAWKKKRIKEMKSHFERHNLKDVSRFMKDKVIEDIVMDHKLACTKKAAEAYAKAVQVNQIHGPRRVDPSKASAIAFSECISFHLVQQKEFWGKLEDSLPMNIDPMETLEPDSKSSNLFDSTVCQRERKGSACWYKSLCKGAGMFSVKGLCPGTPKDVQCCVHASYDIVLPTKDEKCASKSGRCIDSKGRRNRGGKKCDGTLKAGMCGGPKHRQCCIGDTLAFPAESPLMEEENK